MNQIYRYGRWLGLWLCSCFFFAGQAFAGDKVLDVTQVQSSAVSLTEYFSVLEDSAGTLTLADITKPEFADRFKTGQARTEALGFSYTKSAIWLRLHVKNASDQPLERVLEITYALLATVDFYQPGEKGFERIEAGYLRPASKHAHTSRFIALPLVVPAGADQLLYLRIQTPNSLNIPARLWSMEAFHSHQAGDHALQALYFGIVLAIAFYNLMLFIALRDLNYLIYVIFATSLSLALANFTGMGGEFIWGFAPIWTKIGVNVPAALASVAILLFTRRLLNTAQVVPRIDLWIKLFMAANAAFLFLLMLWFWEFNRFFVVTNLLTSVLILGVGMVCASKRQRSAYYFVAAFSVLFLANVLSHMRNLGWVPTNVFTSDGLQIGSVIEMLLLSLALADRFNIMRREKIAAQARALQVQGELVETLRASEHLLEGRVAERTAELQAVNRQLEAISTTDALTGIANRRHFDTVLADEWTRAARAGHTLALGFMDVDWFKKYNDHYGHPAGDECLRQVARVISEAIGRTGDLVARYGGEEFVFITPATTIENAMLMAQRVCAAMQAQSLAHELSEFSCVTVSIGVASMLPAQGRSSYDLVTAADKALYAAKQQGRNRVVAAA
jgi:diguanylate cyclase (GGDEF)-like protein